MTLVTPAVNFNVLIELNVDSRVILDWASKCFTGPNYFQHLGQ